MSETTDPVNGRTSLPSAVELESIAIEVAVDAARTVRTAPGQVVAIRTKSSPTDVLTKLDMEVEQSIRDDLKKSTPGASILGEEHGTDIGNSPIGWIIDPIDGTVNLTYDLPIVSVSIAATIDGDVVAGVVVDVASKEIFSAAAGRGARRNGLLIKPSSADSLAGSLIATGFSYAAEVRAAEAELLRRVLPATRDIRCFGSAALQLCWVACGRVDAYYELDIEQWDYAAGALIALESGALIKLPEGHNGGLVLAASPLVFPSLLEIVG